MTKPLPGQDEGFGLLELLHPYVRQCGDERRPAWRLDRSGILDYLLVYIAEGRGRFIVGTKSYTAEPDDLFWIPPATRHRMEADTPGMRSPFVHFDLNYRGLASHWEFSILGGDDCLAGVEQFLTPPTGHPRLDALTGRIRSPTNRRVGTLISEMCLEALRGQPFASLRLSALMLETIAWILRGQIPTRGGRRRLLLEQATEHLDRRRRRAPVQVSDAATIAGLSPSRFRELFNQEHGCSPRTYQRQQRIALAKRLLVGSPLTLVEIAHRCGYGDARSLSRAFTAVEGMSPERFRMSAKPSIQVEGARPGYDR